MMDIFYFIDDHLIQRVAKLIAYFQACLKIEGLLPVRAPRIIRCIHHS